jgi:hypothetical protein
MDADLQIHIRNEISNALVTSTIRNAGKIMKVALNTIKIKNQG